MAGRLNLEWWIGAHWTLDVDCFDGLGRAMDGNAAPAPASAEFRLISPSSGLVLKRTSAPAVSIAAPVVSLVILPDDQTGVVVDTYRYEIFVTDTTGAGDVQLYGGATVRQSLKSLYP